MLIHFWMDTRFLEMPKKPNIMKSMKNWKNSRNSKFLYKELKFLQISTNASFEKLVKLVKLCHHSKGVEKRKIKVCLKNISIELNIHSVQNLTHKLQIIYNLFLQ